MSSSEADLEKLLGYLDGAPEMQRAASEAFKDRRAERDDGAGRRALPEGRGRQAALPRERVERTMREAPPDPDEFLNGRGADIPGNGLEEHVRAKSSKPNGQAPPKPFVTSLASALEGKAVPEREWLVSDIIPAGNVTLFSGDGGIGKSTLALQLGAAVASEQGSWIGRLTTHGNVLAVLCEDDGDEVHRRLASITAHMRCRFSDLGRLSYSVRVGDNNLLMNFDHRSHTGTTTPFYEQVGNAAVENQIALLILDSLHDFFGGDEINRSEARQFIGALRAISCRADCAIVLLGHPSRAGREDGTGTSGSTGWNNTVRARCYLHRKDKKKDGKEDNEDADDDIRVLEVMKSNYGPVAEAIDLTWSDGVFLPKAPIFDRFHEAEAAFLDCLDQITLQGRYVSDSRRSEFYAPTVFACMARGKRFGEGRLYRAMLQLFETGKIHIGSWKDPSRKPRPAILRTAAP